MISRVAAVGALILAAVVVAVVLMGGGSTHKYFMEFETAGQLVKDDDVQVGGRRIGSILGIELTNDNQARVEIEVEEPFAPLHEGTTGIIRATSLSGIANRYITLNLGPQSNPRLDDGATLRQDKTTSIVDLDQLFALFDRETTKDLQNVIQGLATQFEGKGEAAGRAAEYFNPLLSTSRQLVDELTEDEGTLTEFLVNSSQAVTALADKREDLGALVENTNATAGAIAAEEASLAQALDLLPTTLRRGNSTFVNLRSTLDDLDVLVAESKPATRRLAPFLRELRPLVRNARPTIRDLRTLIRRSGANNDLIDATLKMPRMQRAASPALRNSTEALQKSLPVLEFIRPYTPDLVGWFRDFGQGASAYDANGHYARIQPIFNAYSFTDNEAGGVLTAIPPEQRLDQLDTGNMRRCPGAAIQSAPDGSNPWAAGVPAGGCDPTQIPAGP